MELDRVILDKMDEIKAEWYAQGIDKETGIRDLCFDLDGKR